MLEITVLGILAPFKYSQISNKHSLSIQFQILKRYSALLSQSKHLSKIDPEMSYPPLI